MSKRNNPFNPGSGVVPPFLAGRDLELESFSKMLESIEDGQIENRLMYGLRGTGKTVLMNEFNKICISKKFLPVKRPQFSIKCCDPVEFTKAFKYDLRMAIETFSTIKKITRKFWSSVNYLKPKSAGVPGVFYYEPSYASTDNTPLENHLIDYLVNNWKIIENSGHKGVIFLFDEFHTIQDIKNKRWFTLTDFLGVINEVQNQGCGYYVVLCGLPTLQINVKRSRSYTERMFKSLEISNLKPNEAKLAITEALKKSNYSFASDLVTKIVKDTESYPYFIQFYCKEIINNTDKKNITAKDYELIKSSITKQLEYDFFDPRMEMLSDDEKIVLKSMSTISEKDILFKDIEKKSKIDKRKLSKYLQRLQEKGLVYNYTHGVYRFSVPMLKDYLQCK